MSVRKRGALTLHQFRSECGLTQAEMGAQLGISGPHYSLLELGRQRPTLRIAIALHKLSNGLVPIERHFPELKPFLRG